MAATPLKNGYLINSNRYYLQVFIDKILGVITKEKQMELRTPAKILISNSGHLGDIIISTALIPVLKDVYPNCKIGFLIGSWAHCVLEGHPDISWIHHNDVRQLNRAQISRFKKISIQLKSWWHSLHEIRKVDYDIAIELSPYFTNSIMLLKQTKIPTTIGYDSGGYGPLLTKRLKWQMRDQHIAEYHYALACLLPKVADYHRPLHYHLHSNSQQSTGDKTVGKYIVVHPGAGERNKEWDSLKWRQLVQKLAESGYSVILTGHGAREYAINEKICLGIKNCQNLCNKLNWQEFVSLVAGARLYIGVDSAGGHVAASFDTPSITLMTGINNIQHWRPLGKNARFIYKSDDCFPCYEIKGCDKMNCIMDISIDDLFSECLELCNQSH